MTINCSPKFDESVIIPSRDRVVSICKPLKQVILNQVFTVAELIQNLGIFISNNFHVKTSHATSLEVEIDEVMVNAQYDADKDEKCEVSIEIILATNPSNYFIIVDQDRWDRIIYRLSDVITHELVRMKQTRARNYISVDYKVSNTYKDGDEYLYLSNPDEIDAYSYTIANEIKNNPNKNQILTNPTAINIDDSVNLWAYIHAFRQDLTNPTLKRLLKKVYKRLTYY